MVLNRIAAEVVEEMRSIHPTHVICCDGLLVSRMHNRAWMEARKAAGLPDLRGHDLKHTFGRRLREAGVSFEDRQDLLRHKSSPITTHYSRLEGAKLIEAANRVCGEESRENPAPVILRKKAHLALVG